MSLNIKHLRYDTQQGVLHVLDATTGQLIASARLQASGVFTDINRHGYLNMLVDLGAHLEIWLVPTHGRTYPNGEPDECAPVNARGHNIDLFTYWYRFPLTGLDQKCIDGIRGEMPIGIQGTRQIVGYRITPLTFSFGLMLTPHTAHNLVVDFRPREPEVYLCEDETRLQEFKAMDNNADQHLGLE